MPNTGKLTVTTPSDREVAMTRVFNAPRHQVFDAWSKPEILKRWLYGPPESSLDVCDIDLRAGGALRFVWRGPDGSEMAMSGVYREVVPNQRIVQTELFDEDWTGGEAVITIDLVEQDGQTTCTMTALYSSQEARDSVLQTDMEDGMEMGYARLDQILAETPAGPGLVIERIFDAPREMVWRAWAEPELLMRWWGPRVFSCPTANIDFRVGGKFLFCMQPNGGSGIWATGVYREIIPQRRLVFTDSFADEAGNIVPATHYGMPDDIPLEMLVTVAFEGFEGQTKMTLRHEGVPAYLEQETRHSWGESLDKLAEVVAG